LALTLAVTCAFSLVPVEDAFLIDLANAPVINGRLVLPVFRT
jgi:hypothetical protein